MQHPALKLTLCALILTVPALGFSAPADEADDDWMDWQGMPLTVQGQPDFPSQAVRTIDIARITGKDPILDGELNDPGWQSVTPQTLTLTEAGGSGATKSATLQAYYNSHIIYFAISWDDTTFDDAAQMQQWDVRKTKYAPMSVAEDTMTLLLKTYGDFRGDILTGRGYAADMWRWGAASTNPSGYADDMWRVVLRAPEKGLTAQKVVGPEGTRYVSSLPDKGRLSHRTRPVPERYEGDVITLLEPQEPADSAGDVRARATYRAGEGWRLECARHLLTYSEDDLEIHGNTTIEISVTVVDGATGRKYVSPALALRLLG
ncbi:MAG: hypothetical protein GEEBNDBF_01928 [bacterium]|nr:hypothetical protein [bacterium]